MSANKYRMNAETRKSSVANIIIIAGLGKTHQWVLKLMDEILKKKRILEMD